MSSIYIIPFLFLVGTLVIKSILKLPFFLTAETDGSRFNNLDGFRGVLAFLVYIHHSVIAYRYYLLDRQWVLPDDRVLGLIGQFGVSGFFCLTGFLFWGKVLKNQKLDIVVFFKGRIKRILPAYFASVILLITLILFRTDFELSVSLSDFFRQVFSWLLLGTSGSQDINGVNQTGVMNAYVFWTLRYEFYFYLSLPLLSLFIRPAYFIFLSLLVVLYYTWYVTDYVVMYFVIGAICAYTKRSVGGYFSLRRYGSGLVLLFFLINYFTLCDTAYSWYGIVMSAPIMFIVLNGSDFFSVLTRPCFRFLGEISYSLYLFHGMIIFIMFSLLGGKINYIWLMIITTVAVIIVSAISYFKIERPFIINANGVEK